jgi:hypothetical protein
MRQRVPRISKTVWCHGRQRGSNRVAAKALSSDRYRKFQWLSKTYDHFFSAAIVCVQEERRYRVFADLERIAGRFPHA